MVVLAACGGGGRGGAPLRESQLVTKVNAECRKLLSASNDLAAAQDPNATGAKVRQYVQRATGALRTHADAIGQLVPPKTTASQFNRFVSLLHRYADDLDALVARLKSSETFQDLLNRSTSQVNTLNGLSAQIDQINTTLGFVACNT